MDDFTVTFRGRHGGSRATSLFWNNFFTPDALPDTTLRSSCRWRSLEPCTSNKSMNTILINRLNYKSIIISKYDYYWNKILQ